MFLSQHLFLYIKLNVVIKGVSSTSTATIFLCESKRKITLHAAHPPHLHPLLCNPSCFFFHHSLCFTPLLHLATFSLLLPQAVNRLTFQV